MKKKMATEALFREVGVINPDIFRKTPMPKREFEEKTPSYEELYPKSKRVFFKPKPRNAVEVMAKMQRGKVVKTYQYSCPRCGGETFKLSVKHLKCERCKFVIRKEVKAK